MDYQQLIRELHWLEWRLRNFEDKYGVRSQDFYQAMEAGQLSEFDDIEEPRFHDFLEWHGLYKVWRKREESYRVSLDQHTLVKQLHSMPMMAG